MKTYEMTEIEQYCQLGRAVIRSEAEAVLALESRIGQTFALACEHLLKCTGRIIVTGIGKSGHIANKIASTFASTGTPAFYLHPAEASHGDMGMLTSKDVMLTISHSGSTPEIVTLLPLIKQTGVPLIALTGNPQSIIARAATVHIDVSVEKEACPLGLAPTSSTTASLVMGDALAIALLEQRGFTANDFALHHPGGRLGRKLLLRVESLMHQGDNMPFVTKNCLISDALIEITSKRLGMTVILEDNSSLAGVYTDGDIRRTLDQHIDIHNTPIKNVMTSKCKTITPDMLASEALAIMSQYKITSLIVLNNNHTVAGVVHMHDLLNAGVA